MLRQVGGVIGGFAAWGVLWLVAGMIAQAAAPDAFAVSLRNTNHWMRGGTYGLQAARETCIGICMTNTKPNMPAWGGREDISSVLGTSDRTVRRLLQRFDARITGLREERST